MAKNNPYEWDTDPANNTDVAGTGIQGSNHVSNFDNALREIMAQLAQRLAAVNGTKTTTGSGNAYVVTSGLSYGALVDGLEVGFMANHANTEPPTLAVDGLAAQDIRSTSGLALEPGAITDGQYCRCVYDAGGGYWLLHSFSIGQGLGGSANLLDNGDFQVWQRGTSGTFSGTEFLADRWQGFYVGSRHFSRVAGDAAEFAHRCQRVASETNVGNLAVAQSLPSSRCIPYQGKTITLQFRARKGANFSASGDNLVCRVATGTGTDENILTAGFTGAVNTDQNNTLTSSMQDFSLSLDVPSNATQIAVMFVYAPTGTAGADDWFDIENVKLAGGPVPTRFVPRRYVDELYSCRYFFRRISRLVDFQRLAIAQALASNSALAVFEHDPVMRIAPTALASGTSDFLIASAAGTGIATTNVSTGISTAQATDLVFTTAGSLVAGNAATVSFGSTSNSYIDFNAEI